MQISLGYEGSFIDNSKNLRRLIQSILLFANFYIVSTVCWQEDLIP